MENLASDPAVRRALKVAQSWGISPRRFAGWEPALITTYQHDEGGRIVRSVTTPEPEWDEDDRQLALDLAEYESALCGACGHPLTETTAPENETAYVAGPAVRCHRCTAAERAQSAYQDSPQPGALMIPIGRKDSCD